MDWFSALAPCALLRTVLRLTCASMVVAGISGAGHAWAQAESNYLDYSTTEGCASRAQFVAQVQARTAVARFDDVPGKGRYFTVYAAQNGQQAVGRVTVGRDGDVGSGREVYARSCDEVVTALALIVALVIDPHASRLPDSFPTSNSGNPPNAVVPETRSEVGPSEIAGQSIRPASNAVPQGHRAPQISIFWADVQLRPPNPLALFLGIHAGASVWPSSPAVPAVAWALSLEGEASGLTRATPSIRLSVQRSTSSAVHPGSGGSARFAATTARLVLCPIRLELTKNVTLRPCGGVEGGRLLATGFGGGLANAAERERLWLAIVESVRLQLSLTRNWYAEFEGGMSEPLWRDSFEFIVPGAPSVTIVTTPYLVPWLNLGVGLHFL